MAPRKNRVISEDNIFSVRNKRTIERKRLIRNNRASSVEKADVVIAKLCSRRKNNVPVNTEVDDAILLDEIALVDQPRRALRVKRAISVDAKSKQIKRKKRSQLKRPVSVDEGIELIDSVDQIVTVNADDAVEEQPSDANLLISMQPTVIIQPLSASELAPYLSRLPMIDDNFTDDQHSSSQQSASSSSQPIPHSSFVSDSFVDGTVYTHEFIGGMHKKSNIVYVHEIGYLYGWRYLLTGTTTNVYACRKRSICFAKVTIDEFGVCRQHTSTGHSHPSDRREYERLTLRNKCFNEIKSDRILMYSKHSLRGVYNRYITE